jgi:glutamate-ammonia-ligase adenylyltransferase
LNQLINKFEFSPGFIKKLIDLTEGLVTSDIFEKVLVAFETEAAGYYFTSSSEANLIRILSSIYDKSFFFHEASNYPHHTDILIAIASCSNYLTDIIVRNPEYLHQIFDQNYLSGKIIEEKLKKEISEGVERFKTLLAQMNYLRQIKKRYILKIGVSDILGLNELSNVTKQLSILARVLNSTVFNVSYNEILKKYNIGTLNSKFCMCSLGKLGGNELNYSSDVDLILFYDSDEIIPGTDKEFQEILSEVTQLYIKLSSDITDGGYVYRVDFRLRPDGKYSPLCRPIIDYTRYYETRGEDWERQMLIKLGFLCGDIELYNQFSNFIQPYIYPSTYTSSIKDKIKKMKMNIELQNNETENVKTFWGGIRDVEFSVQALQLLNGGRLKQIRTGNTLEGIELLASNNLLKKNEREIFTEAYIFYRRIEHFLQLMNDQQTHLIPRESEQLNKLAVFLGLGTIDNFREKLNNYRLAVRKIYNEILKTNDNETNLNGIDSIKFKDTNKAAKNIKFLRSGAGIIDKKEFDTRTIESFTKIEPQILSFLINSLEPDRVLENFVKIIRTTRFPSIWYNEFIGSNLLTHFLEICLYSQRAVDLFVTNKILEEDFISRKAFIKDFKEEIHLLSAEEVIFIASVQFALKLIDSNKTAKLLCLFIDYKLNQLCSDLKFSYKYCLCGLGSYGAESMNFASDIDLVVLVEDIRKGKDCQKDFQIFLSKAKEALKPFDVDFRLRPEGQNSPLVWDLINYKEYLNKRARIWEFQTLLKLRFVSGDSDLFKEFQVCIFNKVKSLDKSYIQNEIKKMYNTVNQQLIRSGDKTFHIKKDRGGGLTVDFLLQYICLRDIKLYRKLSGKSIRKIISSLKKEIGEEDSNSLNANFNFLKNLELAIQNIFNTNQGIVHSNEEKRLLISNFFKMKDVNELDKKITEVTKSNNILFEKYVNSNNRIN